MSENSRGHLSADSRIRDILNHPAFAGYGRLTLPWDNRAYDESMRLSDIGSLLPYHSHVNPDDVVKALNRMIDDQSGGKTIFYDFYTEAQKRADPAKRNTGLFFFAENLARPLPLSRPVAGSPMSAPSTKASRTPWRSATKGTMLSS